jgi:hypothetical protein
MPDDEEEKDDEPIISKSRARPSTDFVNNVLPEPEPASMPRATQFAIIGVAAAIALVFKYGTGLGA